MTADTVLAIDQGTSATKAIVLDANDGIVGRSEVPVRPRYLPGGGVEQDPNELYESVVTAGRQALSEAGRDAAAVAIANQGETVLAWDRSDGRALSPAIVWQDRRAESVCAELGAERDLLAARTGLVLDPYFTAPKLTWLRRNVTREGVATTTDTWLVHRLTGEFVTDASTASRSLLLDIDTVSWDDDLLGLFGLQAEPMPRIVECDAPIGTTNAFGKPLAVGGLIVDQQAALLAQGCWSPGEAKCTFGTGAFLLANTGEKAIRSASGLTASVAWKARGGTAYCLDGQIYTAASAVRWLTELGLITGAGDLDRVATDDAAGVLCVPALAGLAAPWWRPDATATFTGMTLATRPEHLVTAVLQGIAAQVAEIAEVVKNDTGTELTTLRVDGGLTGSAVLMQAVADIAQLSVGLSPSPDATAIGAAALARLSAVADLTFDDAVPDTTPVRTFEPNWPPDRAAEFREHWRRVAKATLPDSEDGEDGEDSEAR